MNKLVTIAFALALASPAWAQQNQPGTQNQPGETGGHMMAPGHIHMGQQGGRMSQADLQRAQQRDTLSKRILPADATLLGVSEVAEVREFPEQTGAKGEKTAQMQKEEVVGAGALDRVWSTQKGYQQTVSKIDQALKSENIEVMAKTTTPTSTAWNVRMPDGHVANIVVRNTSPTSIESVQMVAGAGESR